MANSLLYANSYPINDKIAITIPTVGQVIDDEDNYNSIMAAVTAYPQDFMVELDDLGIDFSDITPYELFLLLFPGLKDVDTSLVLGDLKVENFIKAVNPKTKEIVLLDNENDIIIDRSIHHIMRTALYQINHIERHDTTPGNDAAKQFMLERARKKKKRAMRRRRSVQKTGLEELIVSLVNSEQYKYNFEETRSLTIYQFYSSLHQIVRKTNYNNLMIGYYTGSIESKHIKQSELNWLTSK